MNKPILKTTVYTFDKNGLLNIIIYKDVVEFINNESFLVKEGNRRNQWDRTYLFSDYGKYWFLTFEDAIKYLIETKSFTKIINLYFMNLKMKKKL